MAVCILGHRSCNPQGCDIVTVDLLGHPRPRRKPVIPSLEGDARNSP